MSDSDNSQKHTSSTGSNLNNWVSNWNLGDVEKELNISFSGPVTPSFILQKVYTTKLSTKQEEYIAKVKDYLQFIDIDFIDLFQEEIFTRVSKGSTQLLKDVIKEIGIEAKTDPDRLVTLKIIEFTRAVTNLIKTCEELRLHTRRTLYKTTFTRFVRDFAVLCCFKPECTLANDKEAQSVWANFRGMECAVAEPDIRLMKFGLPDEDETNDDDDDNPTWLVVTVVDVKLSSELGPILREPQKDAVDKITRRMESSRIKPSASRNPSSESSSDDESFSVPDSPKNRSKKAESDAESDFLFMPIYDSHKILGQHAGELLFDLHRCFKDTDCKIVRMPGMIIDGVKVIFTLLEMKFKYLKKLRENKKLDEEDKAVIYYSSPYSILNQRDRNIVLEYMMRLNNMINYGYKTQEKSA